MKGVSNNNAQKNKQVKGNKDQSKKPLQVLSISKGDIVTENNNMEAENQNISKKINNETNTKNSQLIPEKNIEENKIPNLTNSYDSTEELNKPLEFSGDDEELLLERKVDEFDFDESEFLEALNANEPIGAKGETISGKIIAVESDGLYVDIGGKAPGFMPKKECGLGVITNFKEKFPIGLTMEVLVIKEQNADGMVTISSRALILRKSWEKVSNLAKNGDLIEEGLYQDLNLKMVKIINLL